MGLPADMKGLGSGTCTKGPGGWIILWRGTLFLRLEPTDKLLLFHIWLTAPQFCLQVPHDYEGC